MISGQIAQPRQPAGVQAQRPGRRCGTRPSVQAGAKTRKQSACLSSVRDFRRTLHGGTAHEAAMGHCSTRELNCGVLWPSRARMPAQLNMHVQRSPCETSRRVSERVSVRQKTAASMPGTAHSIVLAQPLACTPKPQPLLTRTSQHQLPYAAWDRQLVALRAPHRPHACPTRPKPHPPALPCSGPGL